MALGTSNAYSCGTYRGAGGALAADGVYRGADASKNEVDAIREWVEHNCAGCAYGAPQPHPAVRAAARAAWDYGIGNGMMAGGSSLRDDVAARAMALRQEPMHASSAHPHVACSQPALGMPAHRPTLAAHSTIPPPPKPPPEIIMRFGGRRMRNAARHVAIAYHIVREQRRSRNEYMPGWSPEPAAASPHAASSPQAAATHVGTIDPSADAVGVLSNELGSTSNELGSTSNELGSTSHAQHDSAAPASSAPPPARLSPPPTRSPYGMPISGSAVAGCVA